MDDSPSLKIEKEQDEDRAEKHVERLHEVTSPGNVVAEESTPALYPIDHGRLAFPLGRSTRSLPIVSSAPAVFRARTDSNQRLDTLQTDVTRVAVPRLR